MTVLVSARTSSYAYISPKAMYARHENSITVLTLLIIEIYPSTRSPNSRINSGQLNES